MIIPPDYRPDMTDEEKMAAFRAIGFTEEEARSFISVLESTDGNSVQ